MKHTHYFYGDFTSNGFDTSFLRDVVNDLNRKYYQKRAIEAIEDGNHCEWIESIKYLREYFTEQNKLEDHCSESVLDQIMQNEIILKKSILEIMQKSDYLDFSCFEGITEAGKNMVLFLSGGDLGVIYHTREIFSDRIDYQFIVSDAEYHDLIGTGDLYGDRRKRVKKETEDYDFSIK